ncbi:hypothetical protein [Candidatus Phytoplasma sp. AldY-WA1]|uniref:hypothetical protein n=1 Tax=Candidatus Phytoplasma sp. AldY-WA1 TaxID=2852100 RepID=UPI00254A839F|nr:hypothetical protein [Candidatus Phytoplasma sp. AldY-WA1]
MKEILNKKTINLKNLLFLSILMILIFSFIKVSDNLVKKQLRQLAKKAFDQSTIEEKNKEKYVKALTESRKILEECENIDAQLLAEFNNINIDFGNKVDEINIKYFETIRHRGNILKYTSKLEPEQIEKCRQIVSEIWLEEKTEEYITTLTNEEAKYVKIIIEMGMEYSEIYQTFVSNCTIDLNNLKERIKSTKTAKNPKTKITQAMTEYKKTLEEKFKEFKRNIEKNRAKLYKTDEPFYKKIWFWVILTTLTILTIGFFIYKKNKKSKIKKT